MTITEALHLGSTNDKPTCGETLAAYERGKAVHQRIAELEGQLRDADGCIDWSMVPADNPVRMEIERLLSEKEK